MSIEAAAGLAQAASPQSSGTLQLGPITLGAAHPPTQTAFAASLGRADQAGAAGPINDMPGPVRGLFKALDGVNGQARSVSDFARTAEASGGQLTPGEIVQLTMKCQEFTFQCQLTSNIANRSSDGVQQLFKQQG